MKYYKNIIDGYIVSITTGAGQVEITEAEYDNLLSVIRKAPKPPAGYVYMLRNADLTWELVELPPEPDTP